VLGRDGGALAQMLPPFRLGLGGPVGSGRQGFPWIHLHDLVRIIATALTDERYSGPLNAVAPESIDNRTFAVALGGALARPAVLPVPAIALRAIFGEAATTLLSSQFVVPAALRTFGFRYTFPTLRDALTDLVGGADVQIHPLEEDTSAGPSATGRRYLDSRRPTYELVVTTQLESPVQQAFPFFSKAENLGLLTPAAMGFSISGSTPTIEEDATIEYRLRVAGFPIAWRSRIVNWTPGERFVDFQEAGPYRSWWHEHSFRSDGTTTVMEDRVRYAPPFGPIGRIANWLVIAPMLRRIFQYRADIIRLRFGAA
jgi:ligand-binding SRPBCC domain-containing protein